LFLLGFAVIGGVAVKTTATRLALLLQTGRRHTDPTAKKRLQGQKGLTARQ